MPHASTPIVFLRAVPSESSTVERPPSDPLGLIVRAYDRAIAACETFDAPAASQALALLRAGLELDTPAARSFDALYAWCADAVAQRDFIAPARCLRSLRAAWCRAADPAAIFPSGRLPLC